MTKRKKPIQYNHSRAFTPDEVARRNLRIAVEHLDTWKRNILNKLAEIANVTTDRDTRLELDELMDRIADEMPGLASGPTESGGHS